MTEQLDGTAPGEGAPAIAASSYAADGRLLAELHAAWPPAPADAAGRGYVTADLAGAEPAIAVKLSDRFAVALVPEADGSFLVVPVARDEVLVTRWRRAEPGDGLSALVAGVPMASERAIEADQTNASVVVGERAIVKWFRRVGPGPSRAATLIAHLDALGFTAMPPPLGSVVWPSPAGVELTLAQGDAFLAGAVDGWDWAVERLERHVDHGASDCQDDCDPWLGPPLGRLVGRLHAALRTPSATIPEPAGRADAATVAGWRAAALRTLDEALELTAAAADGASDATSFASAADAAAFLGAVAPAMRAEIEALPVDRPIVIQPIHGDLHVGQILEWSGGLAVIDFDGNPALGAEANALRQPAERDIAQMLASLDHLGRVVEHRRPDGASPIVDAWVARTRREFLAALDRPPGPALLAAFEVEQECRELVYAARFLPRWRYAPLATLRARYGG